MSEITAILVTYNSASVIAKALGGLVSESSIDKVIVVDNASSDSTCAIIEKQFPQIDLIRNSKNDGFGRGNNIGLARVTTPYALLVNPDAVLESGAASVLVAAAQRYPDAAILAPTLLDEDGSPQHHGFKRNVFAREKSRDRYIDPEGDVCAEFLSAALYLLNMELMQRVGFFDPEIFLYYEDDDICLRARAAGLGLVRVYGARAVHLTGASSGEVKPASDFFRQQQMHWSRLYLEQKYRGRQAAVSLAYRLRIILGLKILGYCLLGKKKQLNRYRGRLSGIKTFLQQEG